MTPTSRVRPQLESSNRPAGTAHAAAPGSSARLRPAGMALVLALTLLAGCAIGPEYQRPEPVAMPATFKQLDGWQTAKPGIPLSDAQWWTRYDDPELTGLMQRIEGNNQSLLQAEAQLRQANALIGGARAGALPTVGTNVSQTRGTGGVDGYNAGLNISWLADIWGKVRRQQESAEASAQASAADLAAVRLGLQSSLAEAYFRLRILDRQEELLIATQAAYERAAQLTRNQYEAGISARADVVLAETQLEQVRAQRHNIDWQRAQNENAIAVLVGEAPAAFDLPPRSATPTLPELPAALPATLLQRRPDIASAERHVAAANARVGAAQAAWFPDLTLNASGGFQHDSFQNWLTAPHRVWSLGPSLALSLFDGGARSASLAQAEAVYDEQVARYRQTVLDALRETEDALAALRTRELEIARQRSVVALAEENLRLVMNRYQAGIVTYLEVATAQTTELTARRTLLTLEGEQLAASVQLIAALGGGWSDEQLAEPGASADAAN